MHATAGCPGAEWNYGPNKPVLLSDKSCMRLQAVLGLNGIMSCPRLTTFILWLTGHNFRMANVKQAILVQAATAPYYAHAGLQILRCPFFGILLAVCMPGLQVQSLAMLQDVALPEPLHCCFCHE